MYRQVEYKGPIRTLNKKQETTTFCAMCTPRRNNSTQSWMDGWFVAQYVAAAIYPMIRTVNRCQTYRYSAAVGSSMLSIFASCQLSGTLRQNKGLLMKHWELTLTGSVLTACKIETKTCKVYMCAAG